MAQIPNLNTFRRGGLRGRGRGGSGNTTSGKSRDEIIQSTDCDAATSRLSAVDAGYLDDPFAKLLTNNEAFQKRLPLMNRGTYVRTTGIDRIVETFLNSGSGRKQIISLGAGSDTRYFRLKRKSNDQDIVYHEIDFKENNRSRIERLQDSIFQQTVKSLCNIDLSGIETKNGELISPDYCIHALDLRDLPEEFTWVDKHLPTLLISECCLIYLSPDEADAVLSYFSQILNSAPLAVVIYEPIRPNDAFGKTMVRNLVSRGIYLQTLEKYADLPHQRQRLRDLQFNARASDTDFIWREWINQQEKERVDGLEWMDEVEEFILLAKHYCISWGWKNWSDDTQWLSLSAPMIS